MEVFALLEDPSYKNVAKDPTMEQKTAILIKKTSLSEDVADQLLSRGLKPPRQYRFPKIYKEGIPLRNINSMIGAVICKLTKHTTRL
jgi:hypothetical protein